MLGKAWYHSPVLEIRRGEVVRRFIDLAYPNYKRLERKRNLPQVIDYMVEMQADQFLEVRLLLAFVALESLKDTYARSKGLPFEGGFYRKPPGGRKAPRYSFEELVCMMFAEVGMRRGLKRLVRLRNEIIHSGVSRKQPRIVHSAYAKVHDVLREYIMRLLGYRGRFISLAARDARSL